jgi:putative membrane protein
MGHPPTRTDPGAIPGSGRDDMPRVENQFDEKRFVKDNALDGMAASSLGKLALEKTSSGTLKEFSQKTVDQQSQESDALKQIAAKHKIDVPESLDSKRQSHIDKLSKLSGDEFDRAYTKEQVKNLQNEVKELQMAKAGTNPELQGFANKMLPPLEEQLSALKDMEKQLPNRTK